VKCLPEKPLHSHAKDGCPISRSFFARCGIPLMLTAKRVGRIESQRERAVVSHISRKASEIWGTRPLVRE
jgi:hypothetical protein